MIYAVDFDGTLCKSAWPDIGKPRKWLIRWLIRKWQHGHKLILWTCREGESLDKALVWCAAHGLMFDAVNENLPERIALYNNDCRKIGADYYIDDKNLFLRGVNK